MSTSRATVRLALGAQQWLDAYTSARPLSGTDPGVPDPLMWQVLREVRQMSAGRTLRTRTDIVAAVVDATGVAPTRVAAAITYWAEHPDQVTAQLTAGNT